MTPNGAQASLADRRRSHEPNCGAMAAFSAAVTLVRPPGGSMLSRAPLIFLVSGGGDLPQPWHFIHRQPAATG
jgi:hypothetical protein